MPQPATYMGIGGQTINTMTSTPVGAGTSTATPRPSSNYNYQSVGGQIINNVTGQVVSPSNQVGSTVAAANNYSNTPTSNPVVSSKAAQADFTTKLTAYQDLINQMNATSDAKAKADLQTKADQAQKDVATSSQNLENQKVAIDQTKANTDASVAQAKLQAIIGEYGNKPGGTAPTNNTGGAPANNNGTGGAPTDNTGGFQPTQATNDYVNQITGIQDERTNALNSFLQTSNNMIIGLQNSESALVSATTQNFQNIMNAQALSNASQVGQATEANARTGQEYSPIQTGSTLASVIGQGNMRLSEINSQMAKTIADLQTSFAKEQYSMINDQFNVLDKNFADRLSIFKDVHDAVANDLKTQTDAAQKVKDNINAITLELSKNGAPQDVINAATSATTEVDAIQAGAGYFQDPTSTGGQYSAYVKATTAKGLTPMSAGDFISQQKSKEAYNTAYSSAAGKAAADLAANGNGVDPAEVIDATSKSILAQTGLSMPAFQFLTQGTSALTRMTSPERLKYMKEAEDWANKNGVDVSTFKSQYAALNKTVEANLLRNNQAKVTENELIGTITNVKNAVTEANLGDLSKLNVAKIWAGQQLNNASASTFKFHLEQLRKEYATYNAVLGGGIDQNGNVRALTPEDYKAADDVIQNGFAGGSVDGFEKGLKNSTDKMSGVLENSISAQNKAVWDLFGVGKNYQAVNLDPKKTVDTYIKTNPDKADSIAKMYDVPGATDQNIYDYLKANKLVQ